MAARSAGGTLAHLRRLVPDGRHSSFLGLRRRSFRDDLATLYNAYRPTSADQTHFFFIPRPAFLGKGLTSELNTRREFFVTAKSRVHPLIVRLRDWAQQGHCEIALHGYHHHQIDCLEYCTSQEFEFLSEAKALRRLRKGYQLLSEACGFEISGFKPPAWGVGHRSGFGIVKALQAFSKFDYVSLSSPTNGLNLRGQTVSHLWPTRQDGLLNLPQNVSVFWPEAYWKRIIETIVRKGGIINIQTHFADWGPESSDGLNTTTLETMSRMIAWAEACSQKRIWHATHAMIARHLATAGSKDGA